MKYQGKNLEELTLEETFEFEKELMRKSVTIHLATQNEKVMEQFNMYLDMVRMHKRDLIEREKFGIDKPDYKDHESKIIGEDEQEQSNDS